MARHTPTFPLVLGLALLVAGAAAAAPPPRRCDPRGFKAANGAPTLYLYVWSGVDNAVGGSRVAQEAAAYRAPAGGNTAHDFVATVDVTAGSPCFGQVIHEAEVPTSGNEPHHVGLSADNKILAVGGFNSWRFGQPSMYFFDLSDPARPRYLKSLTPTKGAITDDFFRLPNGGFLVSLMGNTAGGSPGRVAEVDASLNLVAEHPRSGSNMKDFNPHGLALTPPAINRMVTLDYVEYASTFKPSREIKYRTTARIWDQQAREIIKVVDLGPKAKGLMTARHLPGAGNGALFLITAGHGVLYVLDALAGTVKAVHDFKVGEGHCVLSAPFRNSTRVLVSLYTTDQVQLLDIANLDAVKVIESLSLPAGAGPHATVLAPGERLAAVSTYYVQHDHGLGFAAPFTSVNEKAVRLFTVAEDGSGFTPHPAVPRIDFRNAFPHRGVARPHGMAFRAVPQK